MSSARNLFIGLSLAVLSLLTLEVGARALLVLVPRLGDPWVGQQEGLDAGAAVRQLESELAVVSQRQRLYLPDRVLFWRLAPDVDMEVENGVLEMRDTPLRWRIRTNRLGFRGGDAPAPEARAFRILILGDSTTFGYRVAEEETYASRLMVACASHLPGRPVVTLNAGVPGYSSHQGKLLARELVADFRPSLVTIAFGANDREPTRTSDAERSAWLDTALGRLTYESQQTSIFRLVSAVTPHRPSPKAGGSLRVDIDSFGANVESMIELAQRAHARVVLLDLTLVGPLYNEVLRQLASKWNVPLLDGRDALDQAWDGIARGVAYRDEVEAWRRFYTEHVVSVRTIYFDRAFYAQRYATESQQQQFITLMADPIHPNGLGHQVIADALIPLVCPDTAG